MNVRDNPSLRAATGAATQYAGATPVLKPYDGPVETVPPNEVVCSLEIIAKAIADATKDPGHALDLKSNLDWLRQRKISVTQRQNLLVVNISQLRRLAPGVFQRVSLQARIYTVAKHTLVKPGKRIPVPRFYGYAWAVLGSAEDLMKGEVARAALNISSNIAIGGIATAISQATVGSSIANAPVLLGTMAATGGSVLIVGVAILVSAGLGWAVDKSGLLQKIENEMKVAARDGQRASDKFQQDYKRLRQYPEYTPSLFGAPVFPVEYYK